MIEYRSIERAKRRGLIAGNGTQFPLRPFNNRKGTKGIKLQEIKKRIYESIKGNI